mmetsp:Transcript_36855/g.52083  ORF Transcript_36855/g.52083 Transcript_36855/m.52083 type:complete len:159 (+) Transcript_36855:179-655(+)
MHPHGYVEYSFILGLWKHATRDITFCLVVDDFRIKYTNKDDLNHLMNTLQQHYKVSIDMKGETFWEYNQNGITLKEHVTYPCSVTSKEHLSGSNILNPNQPKHAPHRHDMHQYGAKIQYTTDTDNFPALDVKDKKESKKSWKRCSILHVLSTAPCSQP